MFCIEIIARSYEECLIEVYHIVTKHSRDHHYPRSKQKGNNKKQQEQGQERRQEEHQQKTDLLDLYHNTKKDSFSSNRRREEGENLPAPPNKIKRFESVKTSTLPKNRILALHQKGLHDLVKKRQYCLLSTATRNEVRTFNIREANDRQLALYHQGVEKIRQRRLVSQLYNKKRIAGSSSDILKNSSIFNELKFSLANERQLALYHQGVAKIRQQRLLSSQSKIDSTDNSRKTVIFHKINYRQRSLYMLGVRKVRQRNRHESVYSSHQVPKSKSSGYYHRLYQLVNKFQAKMSSITTQGKDSLLDSSNNISVEEELSLSRHEAPFDVATYRTAGIFTKMEHDFPDIHKISEIVGAVSLTKEKRAVMNISKLCTKAQRHVLDRYSIEKARGKLVTGSLCIPMTQREWCNDIRTEVDTDTLKLGLRGIVIQYLQDTITREDVEWKKGLRTYDVLSASTPDGKISKIPSMDQAAMKFRSEQESKDEQTIGIEELLVPDSKDESNESKENLLELLLSAESNEEDDSLKERNETSPHIVMTTTLSGIKLSSSTTAENLLKTTTNQSLQFGSSANKSNVSVLTSWQQNIM